MKICNYREIDSSFFNNISFSTIGSVNDIIDDVKINGDKAVLKYSEQFGDGKIKNIKVSEDEIKKAYETVSEKTKSAIKIAVKNVGDFAQQQLNCIKKLDTVVGGVRLGHRIIPIETVGCYIPGGNYPLPSSAVMTIVPAKTAGVKKIIACSPKIQDATIVACDMAGADEIYRVGGVQGIAAMAYGTNTITKVDKIVGPGNKYVTAAKKQVYGDCGIDFLAGPSEVLIIADETANPFFVAADMLAQCEHDKDARAYLICFSQEFAEEVEKEAQNILKTLQTADIATISFKKSLAIVVDSIEKAIELSETRAPEHLEICFRNAEKCIDKFKNYGSLFIGNDSAEVFGDYCAGTNHTLPTNKVSRYSGGLSVFDYIKIQTYQSVDEKSVSFLSETASVIAETEGLFAHKCAAEIRNQKFIQSCEHQ